MVVKILLTWPDRRDGTRQACDALPPLRLIDIDMMDRLMIQISGVACGKNYPRPASPKDGTQRSLQDNRWSQRT